MLDPQARALLDLIEQRGLPPVHRQTPAEARESYRQRRFFTQREPRTMAEVRDLAAPGPLGAIPLRLYRPEGLEAEAPALVYFHGGGWVIGDLDTHDVLCRDLAAGGACVVVAVDYRMGPEHRFPAAPQDCLAAYTHVREQARMLGIDPRRMALGGDSAGGNLAAVVALMLRDAQAPSPAMQLLIYPATDLRMGAPSHAANGQGYLLTTESMQYFRSHYLPDQAQWTDWRASPLLHPDLSRLPPAFVITAGFDPLRDEGLQYADALSAAGTPAQYVCFERQIHGFITMNKVLAEADTAVAACGQALRRAFAA